MTEQRPEPGPTEVVEDNPDVELAPSQDDEADLDDDQDDGR